MPRGEQSSVLFSTRYRRSNRTLAELRADGLETEIADRDHVDSAIPELINLQDVNG